MCSKGVVKQPETEANIAPENRPGPKRKRSYSNHPIVRCENVSFRECTPPVGGTSNGSLAKGNPFEKMPQELKYWNYRKNLPSDFYC